MKVTWTENHFGIITETSKSCNYYGVKMATEEELFTEASQ